MARQRLGVVLLVPEPLATQIDGLRIALGDGALGRIPPHVTLVPPVNVAERDLPAAFAAVRAAAASVPPLSLTLGPVDTFQPVNPVAYLRVTAEAAHRAALDELHLACLAGPLDRPQQHEFVPHVTIADELAPLRLDSCGTVLADFRADVAIDRVHVLAEQPGRVWVPIADMPLGEPAGVVGRGSLPLEISVTGRPDLEAAALLAVEGEPSGLPFAITAREDGVVVAAAWGWTAGDRLELADLVVAGAHRGRGIGRHVLAATEALAHRRACTVLGVAAAGEGAAAALLRGCGWAPTGSSGPQARRRWERQLSSDDA